ncbi:tetratricopeptide repeat protein [Flavobacterium sp.]|uniref:tetratricopeptide repeat protein n=1 Tax=Flavobacterium sp. TaxID=239 RepID=UPI003751D569
MKLKLLFLLFFFSNVYVYAQDKTIDSLFLVLKNAKNETDQLKLFNTISDQYKYSDGNKVAEFGNKALQLSKKLDNKIEEGNAYLNLGNANIILGNYPKALNYFSSAKTIFENQSNNSDAKKGLAKALGSIGIVFSEQSNYTKSLEFYLKSVTIYEEINDQEKCAKLYNNIGVIYQSQKNYTKAIVYFEKTQKIQEKLKDVNIGITYTNIANSYLNLKNNEKAFNFYLKAKSSLDINPNQRALGEWYNNFGLYFKQTNNPTKAIENWNLAIITFKSIDDKFGIQDSYHHLAQLNFEQNNFPEALNFTTKSLRLATELQVLEQKVISEKLLSEIYQKQGNTNLSLVHLRNFTVLKDSLTNEENIRKSVEVAMNYEFQKKQDEQKLVLKEESKRNKLWLLFSGVSLLSLIGIGFLIYNRNQVKTRLTLQKELAEYEQKALHLQMNPHFVFNCLSSISSFIVNNSTEAAVTYLAKFSKLMRLTLEYSKESLIPVDKEIESLDNYLQLEQLRFNNKFLSYIFSFCII